MQLFTDAHSQHYATINVHTVQHAVEFRYIYARPLTYVNCHVAKVTKRTATGYTTPLGGHRPLPESLHDVTYII